ncbi:MAG TPA: Uma2 family endonuclease [Pirellulales bacterium]|nr:Uma2 family endonuclease [Pirellulales bacterium]
MSTTTKVTLDEYHRMIARGEFQPREKRQLELIHGEIVPMPPIGPDHCDALDNLNDWSVRAFPKGKVKVRVQGSAEMPLLESEPQPDMLWLKYRSYAKTHPRPEDVLLVVEVAQSSLKRDRGVKLRLYAEAGLRDYWIVNVKERSIEVYREPEGKRYRHREVFRGDQEVHPLNFPEVALRVSSLFT